MAFRRAERGKEVVEERGRESGREGSGEMRGGVEELGRRGMRAVR